MSLTESHDHGGGNYSRGARQGRRKSVTHEQLLRERRKRKSIATVLQNDLLQAIVVSVSDQKI